MTMDLNRLVGLLEELEELCGQMMPLIAAERQALVNLSLDELPRLAEAKNSLSSRLAEVRDQARLEMTALVPPVTAGRIKTIDQLLELLPKEGRQRLAGPYLRFKAKAREVEFLNANNRRLAEEGMKAMEGAISDLAGLVQGRAATYGRPGLPGEPPRAGLGRVRREV
jgi:hypothetical protein